MGKPDEVYPVADVSGNLTRDDYIYMSSPYSNDCDCWNERGHIYPCMDGQYDVFQINMPGMNASFILQRVNGVDVVKQISDTPLKITPKLDNSTNLSVHDSMVLKFWMTKVYGMPSGRRILYMVYLVHKNMLNISLMVLAFAVGCFVKSFSPVMKKSRSHTNR